MGREEWERRGERGRVARKERNGMRGEGNGKGEGRETGKEWEERRERKREEVRKDAESCIRPTPQTTTKGHSRTALTGIHQQYPDKTGKRTAVAVV